MRTTDGVLHGREAEVGTLASALDRLVAGQGGVVVVRGAPGHGKTALLDHLTARAHSVASGPPDGTPVEVIRLRADERAELVPFGVVSPLLAAPPSPEAPVTPATPGTGGMQRQGAPTQALLVDLLLDGVRAQCERAPVVVAVDDLQWADAASLTALVQWAHLSATRPLLLAVATRPGAREEARAALAVLQRHGVVLDLNPLEDDDATLLLAGLLDRLAAGVPGRPDLAPIAALAHGSPLAVHEIAHLIARVPELPVDVVAAVSGALRPLILRRVDQVSDAARDVLSRAAVLGPTFRLDELTVLRESSSLDLAAPLRELLAADLVRERGPDLGFAHDLVHEAVYDTLPAALRTAHHRDAARLLAAAGAAPERLVPHLIRGARPGDAEAVTALTAAGERMLPTSPASAATVLHTAAELAGEPAPAGLRQSLLQAMVGAGWAQEAIGLCRVWLATETDAVVRSRVELRLAQLLLLTGDLAGARRLLDGRADPAAIAMRSLAHLLAGAPDTARATARQALRDGARGADAVRAWATLTQVEAEQGRPAAARTAADEALRLTALDGTSAAHESQPHMAAALAATDADEHARAAALIAEGRAVLARLGADAGLVRLAMVEVYGALMRGEWDLAVASFEEHRDLARARGVTLFPFAYAFRAGIALHRDGPDEARGWLAEAGTSPDAYRDHQQLLSAAWAIASQGPAGTGEACTLLAERWEVLRTSGRLIGWRILGTTLAWCAVETGRDDLARQVAADLRAQADAHPEVASIAATADIARGLAEHDVGLVRAGARAATSSGRALEGVRARSHAAVLAARQGDLALARRLADEAMAGWRDLGAEWALGDLRARLRAAGVVHGARGSRERASTGWAALTPAESRVARLVAQGCSNPEIAEALVLSRRTVESHVSRILAKLGVAGRGEVTGLSPASDLA